MAAIKNGTFVISLDFELQWGIFDVISINSYKENLTNTRKALREILQTSDENDVRLTIATVGFLFAKDKEELKSFQPDKTPSYIKSALNAYDEIDKIGKNEHDPMFYFAQDVIKDILKNKNHEVCTHTFSHYYCYERGQTIEEFAADIAATVKIGKHLGAEPKSIVFPRNQVNENYLKVCSEYGISSYRGTERSFPYTVATSKAPKVRMLEVLAKRAFRLIDSYINVFGYSTYNVNDLFETNDNPCVDLPSSRFLRPYNKKLSFLEPLKIRRIKKAMTHAAKHNELYHLWWHPHNFGKDIHENLSNLKTIYKHYRLLNKKYGFQSETMESLTKNINK